MSGVIHPGAVFLPALRVHLSGAGRVCLWSRVRPRRGQPRIQNRGLEEPVEEAISGEPALYPWGPQVGLAQAQSVRCHVENQYHKEKH